mgnify:CR=1 FL=1
MACGSVPNTDTFSLSDVISIVSCFTNNYNITDLQAAFTAGNLNSGYFDPTYEGDKDELLNFRNYGSQNALTQFTGSSGQNDFGFLCSQSITTNYWHNGSATYPQVNDNVYTNSNGSTSFGSTYMLTSGGGGYYLTCSSGRVTSVGYCSPP